MIQFSTTVYLTAKKITRRKKKSDKSRHEQLESSQSADNLEVADDDTGFMQLAEVYLNSFKQTNVF